MKSGYRLISHIWERSALTESFLHFWVLRSTVIRSHQRNCPNMSWIKMITVEITNYKLKSREASILPQIQQTTEKFWELDDHTFLFFKFYIPVSSSSFPYISSQTSLLKPHWLLHPYSDKILSPCKSTSLSLSSWGRTSLLTLASRLTKGIPTWFFLCWYDTGFAFHQILCYSSHIKMVYHFYLLLSHRFLV